MYSSFSDFLEEKRGRSMLAEWLIKISDYGDAALSKGIHHFGVMVGIAGGTAVNVAGKTIDATQSPITAFVLEYGGLGTLIAGVMLALKNLTDMCLSILKAYWERKDKSNEQIPPE